MYGAVLVYSCAKGNRNEGWVYRQAGRLWPHRRNLLVEGILQTPIEQPRSGAGRAFLRNAFYRAGGPDEDAENGQRSSSCRVASVSFFCSSWPRIRSTLALTVSSSRISSRAFR